MKIDFANLQLQYQTYKDKIDSKIQAVLNKSNYILGEEVQILEQELQKFTGSRYAITCSSGTDALLLALMAIDIQPGDEVITTPFTWISSGEMIALLKAKPVFVDIEPDTFNIDANLIEKAINKKTKAIMPVSLYGQPADMDAIQATADKYNLKVIVDGAQSFGSTYKSKMDSNLGDISTTSFFPSKPLGCYGDGGAVFTNNEEYGNKIKLLRVHGQNKKYHHNYIGIGGRLDTLQAAILLAKLPNFKQELKARQKVANQYTKKLSKNFQTPVIKSNRTSAWAQYTLRVKDRDNLISKLKEQEIPTSVFYPIPLHLQKCFEKLNYKLNDIPISEKASKEVVSLPMNPFLNEIQISHITSSLINNYKT
ncbi:DegT/DnrJ/EryC1/StrS family aminotransferase [Candidatus Pelagibacter sp.]|nr:DegT/DnrJ/EryC1/StrS family aminotransferase [Candidatus Pelagibacter sp.]